MRRTLAASLLLSSLFLSAVAHASSPSDDASASTLRVSTGIVPPQVLNSLDLGHAAPALTAVPVNGFVSVSYTVDETGRPRDVQILKGINPYWNMRVATAILNLRYKPASMDDKPTAIGMVLNIHIY